MKKSEWFIKDPTVRKVRNRGWRPVTYHSDTGFVSGWIYKESGKWLHFYSPSYGKRRLLSTDKNIKTIE
jgi:hypothetical protein|tara:strand:+ start:439 stop:645 length:207 start_codon:yes stop_codon:yes gene_type:complete